ncbi:sulfite oxidase [Bacillus alkalicellulosilyticus]|uniref:sulfite oxidase n=1 Tax=Alkalihalobacterium alkalicellulosilyticum TaxID=1912214 RepID=UPI000998BB45|nr:sulfite oxidase [Bacillus alkalicellulosilyticus]
MSDAKVRPFLKTLSLQPENQETPISFVPNKRTPYQLFYRRNHFTYPTLTYLNYWLPIRGLVNRPTLFSLSDIYQLPSKSLKVVLECAGDKRSFFDPKVFGEQWEKGAISQGVWKGVSLRTLLELAGLETGAKEVVIEGYDVGKRKDTEEIHRYARSLPIEKALHPDTLIAYECNTQPIPFKHGFPFRLIVPNWYAMASVKWIKQITVIGKHFDGPFQNIDYMYYPHIESIKDAYPVTTINVNSTIQSPQDMEILETGHHLVKGIAWTGKGEIKKVEISTNNGHTWAEAELEQHDNKYGWYTWTYEWVVQKSGEYSILVKATDSFNRVQPERPFWNRKGYGYNAIDNVKVKVE